MGEINKKNGSKNKGNILTKIYDRLKSAIHAPEKDHPDKAQLRVGLIGGDIPVFPPIALFALSGSGLCGWLLSKNRLRYLPQIVGSSIPLRITISAAMIMTSIKIARACRGELEDAGTESNFKPVIKLCDTGPYRYSRNFMYLAALGTQAAASVALDTAWLLCAMLGMGLYLDRIVIPAEEKLLSTEFGQAYKDYFSRVPRWIPLFQSSSK